MFNEMLLAHFRDPKNVGELAEPTLSVDVSNPACGDMLRLSVRLEDGRVREVRYKARGCTASIAAGSALTVLMEDRTRSELAGISAEKVSESVGGLPKESHHAAVLCADAVRALLARL